MKKTPSKIERTLETLSRYYDCTRGAGHTKAMMDGIHHADDKVIVLTHNVSYGKLIEKMSPKAIACSVDGSSELLTLYGRKNPMVVDNAAMQYIVSEAFSQIRNLRDELKLAEHISESRKELIFQLYNTLADFKNRPDPWYKKMYHKIRNKLK
jgi:hypothetical protein